METISSGWDSFTNALTSYYQFRTAEAQADANGTSQAVQAGTIPVQTANPTTTANTGMLNGISTEKMVIGGVLLLVGFVALKKL